MARHVHEYYTTINELESKIAHDAKVIKDVNKECEAQEAALKSFQVNEYAKVVKELANLKAVHD